MTPEASRFALAKYKMREVKPVVDADVFGP
jgi:hypothetical protein